MRRTHSAALSLVALLSLLAHEHRQDLALLQLCSAQATYPIDFSTVPTTPTSFSIPDNTDIGSCLCDLTFQLCDVNCYCDPDCTTADKARFSTALVESPPKPEQVEKCEDEQLVKINARGSITTKLLNNVLCVTVNNNPSLGYFYDSPTSLLSSQLSSLLTESKPYSFASIDTSLVVSSPSHATYNVGDALRSALTTDGTTLFTQGVNDAWRLPGAQESTLECASQLHDVLFQSPTTSSCVLTVTQLATQCENNALLSVVALLNGRRIAAQYNAVPSLPNEYLTIALTSLRHLDPTSGVYTQLSTSAVLNNSRPIYSRNCTCTNVVKTIELRVTHNGAGLLTDVRANVTLTDLVTASISTANADLCAATTMQQSYAVSYLSSLVTVPSTSRPKSGNPGYLIGAPLLAGALTSGSNSGASVSAIAQYTGGLQLLPTTQVGTCDTASTLGATTQKSTVRFGQESYSSCELSLTLNQLAALCASSTPVTLSLLNVTSSASGGLIYIARLGWADYRQTTHWVALERDTTAPQAFWNAQTRTCFNLINAVSIQVFTTRYGSTSNTQYAVVSARAQRQTTNWAFTLSDATQGQLFPVSFSVVNVAVPSSSISELVPGAPPLLPAFPTDLLYPLYIPSAATRTQQQPFTLASTIWIPGVVTLILTLMQ